MNVFRNEHNPRGFFLSVVLLSKRENVYRGILRGLILGIYTLSFTLFIKYE